MKAIQFTLTYYFPKGQGQNPARQASLNANIPFQVPATSVNMLCGSGMKAIVLGVQALKCNDAEIVIAGGQESMSQVCDETVVDFTMICS